MQLVMIVEDDVLARAAMARALGKLPAVEVIEASGVAEATQLIRSLAIHLVVADIELRDGTVLEVLPQLAERRVPVILVSGHVAEFAERLPSGLSIYAKPMTPAQLCDIVTAQLGCGDPRSGFALADYVQLAALGRNSVALEVSRDGEPASDGNSPLLSWQEVQLSSKIFLTFASRSEAGAASTRRIERGSGMGAGPTVRQT